MITLISSASDLHSLPTLVHNMVRNCGLIYRMRISIFIENATQFLLPKSNKCINLFMLRKFKVKICL